jgi:flagellar biosynthetic protein FlhB
MSSERTEQATPKRRKDARKRGEIPRSTELTAAIALLVATLFFRWYGPYVSGIIATTMQRSFTDLRQPDFTTLIVRNMLWDFGTTLARAVAPLSGVIILVSFVSSIGQGGFVVAPTLIKPDFKRVNPANGLKRIFSKRGAFDTAKSVAKLVIIGVVSYPVIRSSVEGFATLTGADPVAIGRAIGSALSDVALRVSAVYLVLAGADYAFQRWDHEKKLRMSLQEVKEEHKTTEGNPEIKARVRRIQRQMARGRMMAEVPSATVVLTNPTHIAVALQFDMQSMGAPVVVAKGTDVVAERIKQIAREHAIPVLENKPLARALHQSVEVGGEIPVALYEAVADVIAYVYRIRSRTA